VIEEGIKCGYAILPFENTLDGYVQHHMDLLLKSGLKIEAEMSVQITFDFVYKDKAKNLYVQYVTKNQCLDFIEMHPEMKIIITDSNVESYERYHTDPLGAAIVPHHLVQKDDLVIREVADEKDNHTRFLILKKDELELKKYHTLDPFKVSLVITPFKDRPGLLFDILKSFAEHHVNLISIMSRPTKKRLGTYHFFIELMSDSTSYRVVQSILEKLKHEFDVNILGLYQVLN
jgi:prephenate dehydratase